MQPSKSAPARLAGSLTAAPAAAAWTLLLLLAGCGEVFVSSSGAGGDAGSDSAGNGGDGGSTGSGAAGSTGSGKQCSEPADGDACQACLFQSCEAEYCDCVGESHCPALFTCLSGVNAAEEVCWQKHAAGISLAGRLQACGAPECPACGFTPVSECQACQYTHCAEETNDCYSQGACYGYITCFKGCKQMGGTDQDCGLMCGNQFGEGIPLAQALQGCLQGGACAETCKP